MAYDTEKLGLYDEWQKKFGYTPYAQTTPTTAPEYSDESMQKLRDAYKTEYDTSMDEAQRKLNYQFAGQGGVGFAQGAPGQYAYGDLYAQRNKDLAGYNRGLLENKVSADVSARERNEQLQFDVANMNKQSAEFAQKLAADMTMTDAEKQDVMNRFNQELQEKKREYDTTMGETQRQYNVSNYGNAAGTGTTIGMQELQDKLGTSQFNQFGTLANLIKSGAITGADAAKMFDPNDPRSQVLQQMISTMTPDEDEVDPMDTYAKDKGFTSAAEMNIAQMLDPEKFKDYLTDPYEYKYFGEGRGEDTTGYEGMDEYGKDFSNSIQRMLNVPDITTRKYKKKKATWW